METTRIERLLKQKEGTQLEFKEAATELPGNLFETVCAMLNHKGGDILLGVKDDGTVTGVVEECIETMVTNLVNLSNNSNKLDPPYILHPDTYTIDGKKVLHIPVPNSSETHKTGSVYFYRRNDGDFRLTRAAQIAVLYNRKQNYFTENKVYPYLQISDFKTEMFPRIRILMKGRYQYHPWLELGDEEMLHKAGFYIKDPQTQEEGYNLASVLLFGRDETIRSIVPQYRIDALLRRVDVDRYDDRLFITTNLVEAYDLLLEFVDRHLPDKFYLEKDIRVSLRAKIFREVVANLIVHREYTSGYSGSFTIYKDRVETRNPNNPHGDGLLLPEQFVPHPKNPLIAHFFAQMGRVDELGSGILNVYKYMKFYSPGKTAQFIEDDLFKTIIPLDDIYIQKDDAPNDALNDALNDAVSTLVKKRLVGELHLIKSSNGITLGELQEAFTIKRATAQRDMKLLKDVGFIEFIGSDKTGKYQLTKAALQLFAP